MPTTVRRAAFLPGQIAALVAASPRNNDSAAVAARQTAAFASVRADAVEPSAFVAKMGAWYKAPSTRWDALDLFRAVDGDPSEREWFEGAHTLIGKAGVGKPGKLKIDTETTAGRAASLIASLELNAIDVQEMSGIGLDLNAARSERLIEALKTEASALVWHGDAALGVNGITGSTATINGLTLSGRQHPDLAVEEPSLSSLSSASFNDAFEAICMVIDRAVEAYGSGIRPDRVAVSSKLWSLMGRKRDSSASGMTLRAAVLENFPEIPAARWVPTLNLNDAGPSGAHGLLAFNGGPRGMFYRQSMAPVIRPPFPVAGMADLSEGYMKIGGIGVGEEPGHCLGWFNP